MLAAEAAAAQASAVQARDELGLQEGAATLLRLARDSGPRVRIDALQLLGALCGAPSRHELSTSASSVLIFQPHLGRRRDLPRGVYPCATGRG